MVPSSCVAGFDSVGYTLNAYLLCPPYSHGTHSVWGVQACEAAAGANPAKRRELEDSSRKLGALLWKLNEGQVSQSVSSKLLQVRRLPGALTCGPGC